MINQLTILAPGLLGASVARTAHRLGLARRIVIWSRRAETRLQLRDQPWCHQISDTPEDAVRSASLVALAAPVEKIIGLAQQISPALPTGAVVTDVGSVKAHLARACHAAMPAHAHFVGAHPMAGSQHTGWENATDTLFTNRPCFVTPLPDTHPAALDLVTRFWHELGCRVTSVSPDEHDEIVAHISHLPQSVATCLASALAAKNPSWRHHAGNGLRDTTRIAASDANMWIEIFQQNRDELLRALRTYQHELDTFTAALSNRDWPELRARLERGKQFRDSLPS